MGGGAGGYNNLNCSIEESLFFFGYFELLFESFLN